MTRLTDEQAPIVAGLVAGARLVGPVDHRRITRTGHECVVRPWGWLHGGVVHAHAVAGLIARGIVETKPGTGARREVVLREME
jgi:hypothetical protein